MHHDFHDFLRTDIRNMVNGIAKRTSQGHSFIWRSIYLRLEATTSFRVPAKNGLAAVAAAGHIPALHQIASDYHAEQRKKEQGPNPGDMGCGLCDAESMF